MKYLLLSFFVSVEKCAAVSGLSYIAQFLPQNPIIIEAGAHRGTDTIAMSRHWPQGWHA